MSIIHKYLLNRFTFYLHLLLDYNKIIKSLIILEHIYLYFQVFPGYIINNRFHWQFSTTCMSNPKYWHKYVSIKFIYLWQESNILLKWKLYALFKNYSKLSSTIIFCILILVAAGPHKKIRPLKIPLNFI